MTGSYFLGFGPFLMSCQKWNIGDDEETFNYEWGMKTEPTVSKTTNIFKSALLKFLKYYLSYNKYAKQ